jgi:glutathione synthase/RimK-type ligase-like ATP-grasp enzyme
VVTGDVRENRQVRPAFLVTSVDLPEGEPGGELITAALADRGVDSSWVVWDDPAVDWSAPGLVAVRSTWDYHHRPAAFLEWARAVEAGTHLLNGAEVFAWNADKGYLVDLALPHVPTALLDDPADLAAVVDQWGPTVVKPRTGASGVGVVVVSRPGDPRAQGLTHGPWVVQPLVQSVRTVGETSVFVVGGRAVSQVDKRPAGDEIRVHEEYGGSSVAAPLDPERAALGERAVAFVGERFGRAPAYARVDVMRWQEEWVVSELELIEPGLYLDVDPTPAEPFADLVASRLTGAAP